MRTGGGGVTCQRKQKKFLIEHQVHKLLIIATKFPVLLKISVL